MSLGDTVQCTLYILINVLFTLIVTVDNMPKMMRSVVIENIIKVQFVVFCNVCRVCFPSLLKLLTNCICIIVLLCCFCVFSVWHKQYSLSERNISCRDVHTCSEVWTDDTCHNRWRTEEVPNKHSCWCQRCITGFCTLIVGLTLKISCDLSQQLITVNLHEVKMLKLAANILNG